MHADAPNALAYVPDGHALQLAASVAPILVTIVPAAQAVQTDAPDALAYAPAWQSTHALAPPVA